MPHTYKILIIQTRVLQIMIRKKVKNSRDVEGYLHSKGIVAGRFILSAMALTHHVAFTKHHIWCTCNSWYNLKYRSLTTWHSRSIMYGALVIAGITYNIAHSPRVVGSSPSRDIEAGPRHNSSSGFQTGNTEK